MVHRHSRRSALRLLAAAALAGGAPLPARAAGPLRIALVGRMPASGFFAACHTGGEEAAKELGTVELVDAAAAVPKAQSQIQLLNGLIAQKVDAIAVSAVDGGALVPVCKKALQRGIKVISFDTDVGPGGRILHLDPADGALIGRRCVEMIAESLGKEGEVAILSGAAGSARLEGWIDAMKLEWAKPAYARMKLVATAYGEDDAGRSFGETQALIGSYPNIKGIVALSPVGLAAAAKAVVETGLAGKVETTGLGLPSQMKEAVLAGVAQRFTFWNPVDLGYAAVMIAAALAGGTASGAAGTTVRAGRVGEIAIGEDGEAVMADLITFDKTNIYKYAAMF